MHSPFRPPVSEKALRLAAAGDPSGEGFDRRRRIWLDRDLSQSPRWDMAIRETVHPATLLRIDETYQGSMIPRIYSTNESCVVFECVFTNNIIVTCRHSGGVPN